MGADDDLDPLAITALPREPVETYYDEKLGAWVKRYARAWAEGSESGSSALPRNYRELE